MKVPFVDLKKQLSFIRPEIDEAINEVVDSTSFINGKAISQFEKSFSGLLGINYTVGVGNGTDALFIALKTLGIGVGDEVITTANSFIATAEAITATGATVVFVDIFPDSFNIDTRLIEQKISLKTRAIVPVHLYGQIADMDKIIQLSVKYNLFVIEDAAQAHIAKYQFKSTIWKQAGTMSHIAAFSFFPGKNLGAFGDAGAVVTNDIVYAKRARMLANHGRVSKFDHEFEGLNSRMDTIQAAVLSVKLKYLVDWTDKRRLLANYYIDRLSVIQQIQLPVFRINQNPVWHLFVILTDKRDDLKLFLKDKGIETGIHYPIALPNLKAYRYLNHSIDDFPVASKYQENYLSLPIFPEMSYDQVDYVCEMIRKFYQKN